MFTRAALSGILAAASICAVSAAEIFSAKTIADFSKTSALSCKNGVYTAKGNFTIFSTKMFQIDPAKKYRISAEVKTVSGNAGYIYLGFKPYDAKNAHIFSASVNPVRGTETELAAPVKKGDRVIKIKNGEKWNKVTPYGRVAFNVKAAYGDMPNYDVILTTRKNAIVKKGNVWEVTMRTPLKKAYPAGTKVRQHSDTSTYLYARILRKPATGKSVKISAIVSKIKKDGLSGSQFWPGTKKVQILLIHGSSKGNPVVEFKNVKLEEIK